jgi:murein DD-endopeptidase MepM/ murein hydrolase activator NlpD
MTKLTFSSFVIVLLLAACAQERAMVIDKGGKFFGFRALPDNENYSGSIHRVKAGESLSRIAVRYKVPFSQMAKLNGLSKPYKIMTGQLLKIPQGNSAPVQQAKLDNATYQALPKPAVKISNSITSSPLPALQSNNSNSSVPQQLLAPEKQPAFTPLPKTHVKSYNTPAGDSAEQDATLPATPPVDNEKLLWPVKGKVISRFGPHKGGLYNDGINIASSEDTPIKAAKDGVVVYAGNELHGYGNLTIIKHDGGLITAYAHQKTILVKKGQHITKGQVIGNIGLTGNVSSPQLHFGIRVGDRAVDPELYLGSRG